MSDHDSSLRSSHPASQAAPTGKPRVPLYVTGRERREKFERLKNVFDQAVANLAGRPSREALVLADLQAAIWGLNHHDDKIAVVWNRPPDACQVAAFDLAVVQFGGLAGLVVHVVAGGGGGCE
jgi:hypothetical protein